MRAPSAKARSAAGQRRLTRHPHRSDQLRAGSHRHHHAPGETPLGVLGDEQRLVGDLQVGEYPSGLQQRAQRLGRLPLQDRLDQGRIGLGQPRVRQHAQVPILDHHRVADPVGQAVGQREKIRWATPGFGLAAFQNQTVDDRGHRAPRHRRIDHQDSADVGDAVERHRRLIVAQHHHRGTRRRRPAHGFVERAGAHGQQDVAHHRAVLGRLVDDDAAQLGRPGHRRPPQADPVAAQDVHQAVQRDHEPAPTMLRN